MAEAYLIISMLGKGLVQSLQIGVGDFIWENETWLIWGDEGSGDFSCIFSCNHLYNFGFLAGFDVIGLFEA